MCLGLCVFITFFVGGVRSSFGGVDLLGTAVQHRSETNSYFYHAVVLMFAARALSFFATINKQEVLVVKGI